jgi:predicted dehydrogenase
MVRIGTVGIGFMGMTHYIACKKVHGGKVTAICTRSEKKLQGDWRDIQGNFGLRGQMEDLSEVRKYQEIDRLLADPGIDLVDICLPTQYHKEVTLKALRAGKHVLLEKPIAIRLSEADEMVATAREMGRHFMVAHVVPFVPEYAFARQAVESGEYGPLLGARFKRTTATYTRPPDPAYL